MASNQGFFRYNGAGCAEIDLGAHDAGLAALQIFGVSPTKPVVEVGACSERSLALVEGTGADLLTRAAGGWTGGRPVTPAPSAHVVGSTCASCSPLRSSRRL